MDLLAKAIKWLNRAPEPESVEEREEQVKFRELSRQIWLEYHGDSPRARAKLERGLHLTPEGLVYMERENEVRRRRAAELAKIKKEIQDEQDAANGNPVGSQQPGPSGDDRPADGGRSGRDGSGGSEARGGVHFTAHGQLADRDPTAGA